MFSNTTRFDAENIDHDVARRTRLDHDMDMRDDVIIVCKHPLDVTPDMGRRALGPGEEIPETLCSGPRYRIVLDIILQEVPTDRARIERLEDFIIDSADQSKISHFPLGVGFRHKLIPGART